VGLLDVVLGRRKPKAASSDRLFAIATGAVTLETEAGLRPSGSAGIVFKPLETADFGDVTRDLDELLRSAAADTGTKVERTDDSFGYRWMTLRDPDLEDLVTSVNVVNESLEAAGYSEQLLCAVFPFEDASRGKANAQRVYWIFNYKRDSFYPFAPKGDKERDMEKELRLRSLMARELPLEREPERWFPLWDVPL
jgi:hypothetical protein